MKKNRINAGATFIICFLAILFYAAPSRAGGTYAVMKLQGSVNPIVAKHLVDSIKKANDTGAEFIVIQLDTPGGLVTSMRDIIKAIMTSEVPVVVYTFPKGAQAASAGGYIMLAAHVAVMAPGTEIGAMHPVSPMLDFLQKDKRGDPAGVMEKKVLNDTIAYARSLAQKRNRNVAWAERAVRNAISSTYLEAMRIGVIDFIAEDMNELMAKLNNRKINLNGKYIVLKTDTAAAQQYEMDWKQSFLNYFADPQIVMLLFIIAVIGIGMEFKNPGMIFPGVIGALCMILFLMAVNILPINIMGLILIVIAVVLFILELKIVSYGLLTLGGIVSFVLGSMILFDSPLPGGYIPLSTIITSVIMLLAFIFIVVRAVINVHKAKVTTGREGLIGEIGEAIRSFSGKGKIIIKGEIWNALSDEEIHENEEVVVTEVRGMNLVVRKKS